MVDDEGEGKKNLKSLKPCFHVTEQIDCVPKTETIYFPA